MTSSCIGNSLDLPVTTGYLEVNGGVKRYAGIALSSKLDTMLLKLLWISMISNSIGWSEDINEDGRRDLRNYRNTPSVNTLRPRPNGCHFPDDISKCIFLNENLWISITISPNFVPKAPIDNIPSLVQIIAWRWSGDKPLSEPIMVRLPTHICVTRSLFLVLCGADISCINAGPGN